MGRRDRRRGTDELAEGVSSQQDVRDAGDRHARVPAQPVGKRAAHRADEEVAQQEQRIERDARLFRRERRERGDAAGRAAAPAARGGAVGHQGGEQKRSGEHVGPTGGPGDGLAVHGVDREQQTGAQRADSRTGRLREQLRGQRPEQQRRHGVREDDREMEGERTLAANAAIDQVGRDGEGPVVVGAELRNVARRRQHVADAAEDHELALDDHQVVPDEAVVEADGVGEQRREARRQPARGGRRAATTRGGGAVARSDRWRARAAIAG